MKYIHLFPDIETANTMGENGLDSPQVCMVKGKKVNILKVEGEKLTCSFNSNGSAENITPKFTVTLTAGDGGTVSGGGSYTQGTTITITASVNTGYKFKQWSDGDTNASRSIVVNNNITLSASFEQNVTETWCFNETLEYNSNVEFNINFVSNNISFTRLSYTMSGRYTPYVKPFLLFSNQCTYEENIWTSQTYRTIILEQPATGDLLTFLQANATKIS